MARVAFDTSSAAASTEGARLDASQAAIIALPDGESAAVIGAAGSGKTTTLVELVADRVLNRHYLPHEVLTLTTARATATRLRDAIALRLGRPTSGPMARTVTSLAFEVAREAAQQARAVELTLVTGGEQDSDIAQLLEGDIADGTGPHWPEWLGTDVRGLGRFRTELRELMMRATEYDISSDRLRALGREHEHPEWTAAADFIDRYLQVVSFSRPGQLDAAELARFAAVAIASDEPGETVAGLRLVLVDDLQEATESTLAILRALAGRGVDIIAFGDPDVAANAFRGGEPDALGRLSTVLGIPHLETRFLTVSHRQSSTLRAMVSGVTDRVGAAAAGRQRRVAVTASDPEATPVVRIEATSAARQSTAIAGLLRRDHLENAVRWSDCAVVLRNSADIPTMARALALAEVPVRTTLAGTALRDDAAARALLEIVAVGIGMTPVTSTVAETILTGPFGGLDRVGLRRLRLALRAEELASGNARNADELLVEALGAVGGFVTIDHPAGRAAQKLAQTLAELRSNGGSAEELLWLAWERSGVARRWHDDALSTGITAADANRRLDGTLALFTAAKRYVERRPDDPPAVFITSVLEAEVAEDTLAPRASDDAVLVTTAQATIGLEFDTVVIASLQEGVWPNLRLRGSLLAPDHLVRVITGVAGGSALDERKQVLGDELRMFALAASRAARRLILSNISNDDEAPSMLLALVPSDTPLLDPVLQRPTTLRSAVGRLRRELSAGLVPVEPDSSVTAAAASLAALTAESIPGADPSEWHGLFEVSSTARLFEDQQVPVSPSALQRLTDSPLDWFLESVAGSDPGTVAKVGTIIHAALETAKDPSIEGLWEVVEARWPELRFDAPWLAERQRRLMRRFVMALAEYLADFTAEGKQLVGAESRFQLEIDRAIVRGSIDRVERSPDGSVVIVDLKTGSPITSDQALKEHPQLSAYQLAYTQGLLDAALAPFGPHHGAGAKLLFVKEGVRGKSYREGVQSALDSDELEEFRQRVREAVTLIGATRFRGPAELGRFAPGDVRRLRLPRVPAVSSD